MVCELLDVRAVAGLGHREAAGQLERWRSPSGSARGGARVPSCWIAPPHSPNWTPNLTSSERSPSASVSNAATFAPGSPWPPNSLGEAGRGQPLGGERPRPLEHALAVLGGRQRDRRRELGPAQDLADLVAQRRRSDRRAARWSVLGVEPRWRAARSSPSRPDHKLGPRRGRRISPMQRVVQVAQEVAVARPPRPVTPSATTNTPASESQPGEQPRASGARGRPGRSPAGRSARSGRRT